VIGFSYSDKKKKKLNSGGHDIQLLSRFVGVQRTAFHKLLKKYKKWTGSAHLSDRFNVILESPTSFTQLDFENNVQDVSSILMAIRDGVDSLSDIPSAVQSYDTLGCDYSESFAAQTTESPLDMDCEFYAFDAAKRGGRAIFWVHSDHIIEVQVFLLKQLLLQSYLSCRGQPSKHSKFSKGSNVASPGNDEITTVVLENLEHISQVSSVDLEPMSQKKMKTAAHVQWCSGGTDAFVIASGNTGDVLKTTVKRKQVETLFDSQSEIFKSANNNTFEIRNWINKHPMVVPLVKILSKRTRFTGRATDSDIWAFLDRDVRIGTCKNIQGWATSNEVDQTLDITNFPYAILEIVWDGTQMPEFVQELTQHHIVEIMNGFSLQVYALVAIYGLKNIVPRCWVWLNLYGPFHE
jgi:SPX domain protein involved in polyphosphate accumulation